MSETIPETQYLIQHSRLSSKFTKAIDHQLSAHGISFTEYLVLHYLCGARHKTLRRMELAECVGLSASGVTRLIAPMEKIKLVEKESNPRDARLSLVKLSSVGEQIYQEASVSFEHGARHLVHPLRSEQLAELVDLSRKLL